MAETEETTAAKKKPARRKKAKKPVEVVPTSKERASAVIAGLKSRHPGKVFRGREYTMPWLLKRLPTGLLELDIACGGGFPAGGFTMIYGPQGIGKNWLANQIIRNQQLFLGDACNIAVVSTEMPYDKTFAQASDVQIGFSEIEIDALDQAYYRFSGEHLSKEEVAELRMEIGTFVTIPPSTAEKAFQLVIELVESREFDVVIIDSFGSLLTEDDESKEFDDNSKVGGASLLNTRLARKMNAAMAPDESGMPNMTCVIGINQVRDNMNRANKYSPTKIEPGGWALKHARWLGIELSPLGKVRKGAAKDKGPVLGKTVGWKITKQKAGGHEGAQGDYDFIWSMTGIDRTRESMRVAAAYGIVEKSGSWYSYAGERLGQGITNAADAIREKGLLGEIEEATLQAAGVRCNYLYGAEDEH